MLVDSTGKTSKGFYELHLLDDKSSLLVKATFTDGNLVLKDCVWEKTRCFTCRSECTHERGYYKEYSLDRKSIAYKDCSSCKKRFLCGNEKKNVPGLWRKSICS